MRKATLILCFIFVVVLGIAVATAPISYTKDVSGNAVNVVSTSQDTAQLRSTVVLQQASLPEHVPYMFLFQRYNFLREKAQTTERLEGIRSNLPNLIKSEAAINDKEDTLLAIVASDTERELAIQDAKAKVIIDAFRARFPGGLIPLGESLPPPPPELTTMQEERNQIILRGRDRLRKELGEEEYARFDNFVKSSVTPRVLVSSLGIIEPVER